MRLSGKTIIERDLSTFRGLDVDFDKDQFDGSIKEKGQYVIHEKAYLCPCKSKESDHLNTCKNCGGVGWIFANPTKTKMILVSVSADGKYKEAALREWGMTDMGSVQVTAYPFDKLSFMDKIVALDATSEHQQILYPALTDGSDLSNSISSDDGQYFAFTKYDIKSIDYVALFEDVSSKLTRLTEFDDYTFQDNVFKLQPKYNNLINPCLTIRYIHNPVYHIMDIPRESIASYINANNQKIILPNKALAKRAHLIKDVENFDGTRLLDNSWLPLPCQPTEISSFIRQLRYASPQTIFDNLTDFQKQQLLILLS